MDKGALGLIRNHDQYTAVLQLLSDLAYMFQRVDTDDSYVFYFGIYLRRRFNFTNAPCVQKRMRAPVRNIIPAIIWTTIHQSVQEITMTTTS